MRVWDMGGSSAKDLDYSGRNGDGSSNDGDQNMEAQMDPVCNPRPLCSTPKRFLVKETSLSVTLIMLRYRIC